jgi:lycopene beta-cyclase
MKGFDYVLVGGGLQSGLLALALRAHRPEASIALVERADALGGNHTWCFHRSDVPGESTGWIEPLVTYRWPGYDILFPRYQRRLDHQYFGVSSDRLHAVVSAAVCERTGSALMLGREAVAVTADTVRLRDGVEIRGKVVVDARGPTRAHTDARAGYQKFLGLEVELEEPHGLGRPILMDATVDQSGGYRFFYVLPTDARSVLVEDTYFHDSPDLDRGRLRQEVLGYVGRRGWKISGVRREEHGVLPMPWAGRPMVCTEGPLAGGYRGGWFHPGTGYSFPVAARLADFVARRAPEALFGAELERLGRHQERQARFARFLNRLLFRWYPPASRRAVFERFYRLPESTIVNWYALRLRRVDALRMVLGSPPRGLSIRHRLRPRGG